MPRNRTVGTGERAVAMFALRVFALIERLADEAPLDAQVGVHSGSRKAFIDRPGRRTVIENAVVRAVQQVDAVGFLARLIAEATAEVTHHDIVRGDPKRRVTQAHAIARRALAGNREERFRDIDRPLERDGAGHAKEHDARTIGLTGGAKTAGAGIVEIGDKEDFSPAAARRIRTETFGSGKG